MPRQTAARKPFEPKPWGVGARVEVAGRAGVVWSPGPLPASAWVLGDDGETFGVKLPTKTRPARILDGDYSPGEAAWLLRYAETIRHGVAFRRSALRRTYNAFSQKDGTVTDHFYSVHAGSDCPHAVGEVAEDFPLYAVAARQLQRQPPSSTQVAPELCGCLSHGVTAMIPA